MEGFVKFKLSYGGKIGYNPDAQYVGGSTEILRFDRDRISLLDLQDFVEQEGYKDIAAFYYKFPKTHLAFRQKLETDIDVMDMLDLLKDGELVDIYVEHAGEFNEETNVIDFQSDEAGVDEAKIVDAENIVDMDAGDAFTREMPECTFENVESMDDADERSDSSDTDGMFCESEEDENIEQIRVNVTQSLNRVLSIEKDADNPDELLNDKDYVPSEELISDSELSGKEDGKKHYRWFNEKTDFHKDIELSVGMKFRDASVFRSALRELAVKKKFDFDYINNRSGRISAQCRNQNCPWRIAASRHVDTDGAFYFQINSLNPHEKCALDFKNMKLTATYLATHYLEAFRDNLKWETHAFQKHVKREFENLIVDIGNSRNDTWCFISDQQKGLHEALKELYPNSEHPFCVRHLYANFRKIFKGKHLKDAMWACARATTSAKFRTTMEYVKALDKDAYAYLSKLDPAVWSRHGFTCFVKSDTLCSNISECFNSFIKVAREQPIITCLETIRKLLMKRFHEKRIGIEKYCGDICPRISKNLEDNKKVSMHCNVTYGGGHTMEVEHTIHGSFVVNVLTRSCTCRIWDLTGISCCHTCAAIRQMRGNPADYVHQSYQKSEFMKAYDYHIQPIPGPTEWPQQEGVCVLPSLFRRQAGRPRRRRIREVAELVNVHKKSKSGIIITCGRCGSVGHNARRCKGDITDPRKVEQEKKDAARAAKNKTLKKQATNGSGDGDGKLKKANVLFLNSKTSSFNIQFYQI
ncbi:hypothetical protein QQ045_008516 [Rhodiola kirilowii]